MVGVLVKNITITQLSACIHNYRNKCHNRPNCNVQLVYRYATNLNLVGPFTTVNWNIEL